jgi:8-amino-7-oxononanoate synthase
VSGVASGVTTSGLPGGALARILGQRLGPLREIAQLRGRFPLLDRVVEEIDGRRIRIGDSWLVDFASCNYLGLDLDPSIIDAVPGYLDRWGTHPSWSRMLATPRVMVEIEDELAELLGVQDTLVLPSITHIHNSVLPVLAGSGTIFAEVSAHHTIHEGCARARSRGAAVVRFRDTDLDRLRNALRASTGHPRVICIDGVNSMTGNPSPVGELAALAREHEALLYIDDAHGFGIIGERSPAEPSPYGVRGNSIVRHSGESYGDEIVLVGGFSKAYSSLLAFVACPRRLKTLLSDLAAPYTFSGPPPVASLATAQLGLRFNAEHGDRVRADVHRKTRRLLSGMAELGLPTPNTSGLPIVEIPVGESAFDAVGELLFAGGVYAMPAPFPVVPRHLTGFRFQVTAANTDEQIGHLLATLAEVAEMLHRPPAGTGDQRFESIVKN